MLFSTDHVRGSGHRIHLGAAIDAGGKQVVTIYTRGADILLHRAGKQGVRRFVHDIAVIRVAPGTAPDQHGGGPRRQGRNIDLRFVPDGYGGCGTPGTAGIGQVNLFRSGTESSIQQSHELEERMRGKIATIGVRWRSIIMQCPRHQSRGRQQLEVIGVVREVIEVFHGARSMAGAPIPAAGLDKRLEFRSILNGRYATCPQVWIGMRHGIDVVAGRQIGRATDAVGIRQRGNTAGRDGSIEGGSDERSIIKVQHRIREALDFSIDRSGEIGDVPDQYHAFGLPIRQYDRSGIRVVCLDDERTAAEYLARNHHINTWNPVGSGGGAVCLVGIDDPPDRNLGFDQVIYQTVGHEAIRIALR